MQNDIKDTELRILEVTLSGIEKAVRDFREQLFEFDAGDQKSETRVKNVQDAAFRALKDIETFLNTDAGGEHLFSGSRVTTASVNLNLTTLSAFQSTYDGEKVLYPITRDAHLSNLTTSTTDTGNLTFTAGASDTITAATADSLKSIPVGTKITIAGSASNNGDYTVVANTGTQITVEGTIAGINSTVTAANAGLTNETVAATIKTTSFYSGDVNSQKHRVSKDRDFTQSLNAIDPAFEKAIRAIGIMAQGVFGTNGGLDNNVARVADAIYLLNDSLDRTSPGLPTPFGTEQTSNLGEVQKSVGFQPVLIDQTNKSHTSLIGFFEQRISDTENVNKLEAVSRLLDDQQALEASFQALARIRGLTLGNFLK